MSHSIDRYLLAVFLIILTNAPTFAQTGEAPGRPIPQWLLDEWENRTAGSGAWITDNAAYKNEQEPFDAYGIQWEYGLGKKHLKGRLFCMRDGEDVGSVWSFTQFWDPSAGEARILQIGSDGTVGQGKLWQASDGKIMEQQVFVTPGAGAFESGHHSWMEDGAHHTQSFSIVNGEWIKRRYYVWKLEAP